MASSFLGILAVAAVLFVVVAIAARVTLGE
jgi:hypothetical protein